MLAPLGPCPTRRARPARCQVTNSSSLGSGPVALSNGVLQANSAVTLTNPVSLTGGPLPVVLAGSAITIANPAALAGNATLSVNNTTTFNSDLAGTSGLTLTSQPVVAGTDHLHRHRQPGVHARRSRTPGPTTVGAGTLTLSGNGTSAQTAATNAVQTIASHKVASGTFTLTFNGQTGAITYSTTPATTARAIQTALAGPDQPRQPPTSP